MTRPSGARAARPTTSAWALRMRQSWKRGGALRSRGRSMKAARSSGWNRPERSRSAATTSETSSANCGSSPRNSGTAMGMGARVPWVMSTSSGPPWPARARRGTRSRLRRCACAEVQAIQTTRTARTIRRPEATAYHLVTRRALGCLPVHDRCRHAISLADPFAARDVAAVDAVTLAEHVAVGSNVPGDGLSSGHTCPAVAGRARRPARPASASAAVRK